MRILSLANVGNHLHLQMRITNRAAYNAFIRATTGAIAMGVMRRTRRARIQSGRRTRDTVAQSPVLTRKSLNMNDGSPDRAENHDGNFNGRTSVDTRTTSRKFWDYRPFSRIANSFREYLNLKDYVRLNHLEGDGYRRDHARNMVSAENILNVKLARGRPM